MSLRKSLLVLACIAAVAVSAWSQTFQNGVGEQDGPKARRIESPKP